MKLYTVKAGNRTILETNDIEQARETMRDNINSFIQYNQVAVEYLNNDRVSAPQAFVDEYKGKEELDDDMLADVLGGLFNMDDDQHAERYMS